jgi:hypothetical protein
LPLNATATTGTTAYDRSRDRELLLIGIPTVRFTGSEIHHSAERCADEVLKIFAKLVAVDELPLESWHHGYSRGKQAAAKEQSEEARRPGPTGAEIDAAALGFSRGISHAAQAMSVEFCDLHPEEHF